VSGLCPQQSQQGRFTAFPEAVSRVSRHDSGARTADAQAAAVPATRQDGAFQGRREICRS